LTCTGQVYTCGDVSGNINRQLISILIPEPIELMSLGHFNLFLLTTTGQVYASGYNEFGQLGLGDDRNRTVPELLILPDPIINLSTCSVVTFLIDRNHNVYKTGQELIPIMISIPAPITLISNNDVFTLMLTTEGQAYASGTNICGQLGFGDYWSRSQTLLPFSERVIFLTTGSNFTVLLTVKGDIYTCGDDMYGQLGLNRVFYNHHNPVPILVPLPKPVISVATGSNHTVIADEAEMIYTCGCNHYGQLGLSDHNHRSVPTIQ